jgi:nitrite reductase/ring-hydroxylating ferredoxin subunit
LKSDSKIVLLDVRDVPDGGSRGLTLPPEAGGCEGFVVRQGEDFFAYVNRCPHTGAPLDWSPDQFLNADGSYIICAMHGALFEIENGRCIYGPCARQSLEPLLVEVEEGMLLLKQKQRIRT